MRQLWIAWLNTYMPHPGIQVSSLQISPLDTIYIICSSSASSHTGTNTLPTAMCVPGRFKFNSIKSFTNWIFIPNGFPYSIIVCMIASNYISLTLLKNAHLFPRRSKQTFEILACCLKKLQCLKHVYLFIQLEVIIYFLLWLFSRLNNIRVILFICYGSACQKQMNCRLLYSCVLALRQLSNSLELCRVFHHHVPDKDLPHLVAEDQQWLLVVQTEAYVPYVTVGDLQSCGHMRKVEMVAKANNYLHFLRVGILTCEEQWARLPLPLVVSTTQWHSHMTWKGLTAQTTSHSQHNYGGRLWSRRMDSGPTVA